MKLAGLLQRLPIVKMVARYEQRRGMVGPLVKEARDLITEIHIKEEYRKTSGKKR